MKIKIKNLSFRFKFIMIFGILSVASTINKIKLHLYETVVLLMCA